MRRWRDCLRYDHDTGRVVVRAEYVHHSSIIPMAADHSLDWYRRHLINTTFRFDDPERVHDPVMPAQSISMYTYVSFIYSMSQSRMLEAYENAYVSPTYGRLRGSEIKRFVSPSSIAHSLYTTDMPHVPRHYPVLGQIAPDPQSNARLSHTDAMRAIDTARATISNELDKISSAQGALDKLYGTATADPLLVSRCNALDARNDALESTVATQRMDLENLRTRYNEISAKLMHTKVELADVKIKHDLVVAQSIQTADDNNTANRIVTTTCCVCLVEAAICVMVPCGHLCLCSGCRPPAYKEMCPICKTNVSQIMKIYTI